MSKLHCVAVILWGHWSLKFNHAPLKNKDFCFHSLPIITNNNMCTWWGMKSYRFFQSEFSEGPPSHLRPCPHPPVGTSKMRLLCLRGQTQAARVQGSDWHSTITTICWPRSWIFPSWDLGVLEEARRGWRLRLCSCHQKLHGSGTERVSCEHFWTSKLVDEWTRPG